MSVLVLYNLQNYQNLSNLSVTKIMEVTLKTYSTLIMFVTQNFDPTVYSLNIRFY